MESILYEESTSRLLFRDAALLLPGVVFETSLTHGMNANLRFSGAASIPANSSPRTPRNTLRTEVEASPYYEFGLRRDIGDFYLLPGRCREEWTDPLDGVQESSDSLTVGPSLVVGTAIDWSPLEARMEMGLVFPSLDDVQGRVTLSLLAY